MSHGKEAARDLRLLPERITRRIRADVSGCWLWTGTVRPDGYVRVHVGSKRDGTARNVYAHRLIYELLVGPIDLPELDHLCRVRHCVNPAHMEPVDHRTNTLRGSSPIAVSARQEFCINGHRFDHHNGAQRICRTCRRETSRRYRLRLKEAS